jgi:ATP-dependent RNA helicase UAP56/SUB2
VHQINAEMTKLSEFFRDPPFRVGAYFGGTSIQENSRDLADPDRTPHVIVATPGRLKHLFENNYIRGKNVDYFVVDECDNILGQEDFKEDLLFVLSKVNPKRQVLLFTATLSEESKGECLKIMG